jgi:hypothetical protein
MEYINKMQTIFHKRYDPNLSREILSYIDPVRHHAEKISYIEDIRDYLDSTTTLDVYHIFKLICTTDDVDLIKDWYDRFDLYINDRKLDDLELYVSDGPIYAYLIHLERNIDTFKSIDFHGGTLIATPFVIYSTVHYNKDILLILIQNDVDVNAFGSFVDRSGVFRRLDPIRKICIKTLTLSPFDTTVLVEVLKKGLYTSYEEMVEHVTYAYNEYRISRSKIDKVMDIINNYVI